MAYIINRFNGRQLTIVDDGILDTSTSVGLIGRNYTGYGEVQNENFIWLLENFSNSSPPGRALSGQIWHDSTNKALKVFNGTDWLSIGNATVAETEPGHTLGGLWLKTATQQLYISDGTVWKLVGPEAAEGFLITRLTSSVLKDTLGQNRPVILTQIDGEVTAVYTNADFTIGVDTPVIGFTTLNKGINLKSDSAFTGALKGNADTATALKTARKINTIDFNGTQDITIRSSTTKSLQPGDFILGSTWDGTFEDTWAIDATPRNLVGKIVSRDSNGEFAASIITSDLIGNVSGNVTALSGISTFDRIAVDAITGNTFSGLAARTTRLDTARKINTVFFDGTQDITLPVPAETLVGERLATNVFNSSLRTLGTLISLNVESAGVQVGSSNDLKIYVEGFTPIIESQSLGALQFKLKTGAGGFAPDKSSSISYISSSLAAADGLSVPSLVPDYLKTVGPTERTALGTSTYRWSSVFANKLNSDTLNLNTISGRTDIQGQVDQVTFTNNLIVNGSTYSKFVGPLTGNVTGNLTGSVFGASSLNLLKTGDTMTGDINWSTTARGLNWAMNTDFASIRFYNSSDSDPISRLEFQTGDNGNEYFSWTHLFSGGNGSYESMRLVPNTFGNALLTVFGTVNATTVNATFAGNGYNITSLNPSNISGTVPQSKLAGTYNIAITGNALTATTATNLSGGTVSATTGLFTGLLNVSSGSDGGIKFPNDPAGGSGDTASITYEGISSDRTRLRFRVSNDVTGSIDDKAEFITPDNNGLLINNNVVLNAANYNDYAPTKTGGGASGTWNINVYGNAATVSGITSSQVTTALGYVPANGSGPGNINGDQNYQDYLLRRPTVIDYSLSHNALGAVSGATTINHEAGNYVSATAVGAVTWYFTNPPTGQRAGGFILALRNGGAYTQYWPATIRWPAGSAPALSSSGIDVLVFLTDDAGANWRGAITMGDSR